MVGDGRLGRVCAAMERVQQGCLAFVLVVLFADLLAQVLSRFVFRVPLVWTEELSRLSMIWMVFLGAGLAIRRRAHFVVEFVVQALPAGARRLVRAAIFLLLLGVSGVFLVQGTLFARMGLDVVSPTMDVRMVWSYAAVPAGGLFMMLYSLERLLAVLQGREQA